MTERNFTIYNASAGSGKTYTLAVQYIARLISTSRYNTAAYRQILAVTFTNKATAEMKDRILQQLYGVGYGLASSDNYLKSIREALEAYDNNEDETSDDAHVGRRKSESGKGQWSEEVIRCEARKILSEILHDYSHFRVETIDSFFRSVFSDMARELGLPAGLRADIDQRGAISEAVDRIIEHLDSDPKIRRWITQFVSERMDDGERWDVSGVIKEFALHLFDEPYLAHEKALTEFLSDDANVNALRAQLEKMRHAQYNKLDDTATAIESAVGDDLTCFAYYKDIEKHIAKLRAVRHGGDMPSPSTRLSTFASEPTSLLKGKDKTEAYMLSRADVVSACLAQALVDEQEVARMLNSINLTRQNINPLRLLNTVGSMMNEVTQERGAFLLANTPLLLNDMVKEGDAAFMYEKMGTQLRHIMLDEFQDTSGMQWCNFKTLIDEVVSSKDTNNQRGTTLVVGDIKQSIYRWRGGDWRILAQLPQRRSDTVSKDLSTNYRSSKRVIDFNNRLYMNVDADSVDQHRIDITQHIDALRHKQEGTWTIAPIYAGALQHTRPDADDMGYVQVVHYSEGKADEAHKRILNELCDTVRSLLRSKHPQGQIAILVRRKKEMDMVAKAFAEQLPEVSLVSDEIFRLNQSIAINILVNALRVVLHPDDNASLARLVLLTHRTTVSNYSDEVAIEDTLLINELYDDCAKTTPYKASMSNLPEAFADLHSLRRKPIFELVMTLAEMFAVDSLPGQSAYLMTFYDSIASNISESTANISTLLNYWDDVLQTKSIPGGEVEGINIMTIHRAKGLQWKTVLIPFCDWTLHDATYRNSIFWSKPADDALLCGLPIAAVPLRHAALDSIYQDDYINELRGQRVDSLNLLYVATTRPEDNLYLWGFGNEPKNNNATMMALIAQTLQATIVPTTSDNDGELQRDTYVFGDKPITAKKDKDKNKKDDDKDNRLIVKYTTPTVDLRAYPAKIEFRQSSEAKRFTAQLDEAPVEEAPVDETPVDEASSDEADKTTAATTADQTQTYINKGTILHAIFAQICSTQTLDADLQRALATLPSGLVERATAEQLVDRAKRLLLRGCRHSEVRDWFSGRYELHNECNIVSMNAAGDICNLRPDRVMKGERDIIVVDYKFGRPEEGHSDQVQDYVRLLATMYSKHTVRGYLWYVYDNTLQPLTPNL